MVPACSDKVSRVSSYSGYCLASSAFEYVAFTPSGRPFHAVLLAESIDYTVLTPQSKVWALPRSLAATYGITFVFSSSGYLDVSVHRVPSFNLWIQLKVTRVFLAGLPHSEICGSIAYLQLTAAFRSLSRLSSALSAKASALRPI